MKETKIFIASHKSYKMPQAEEYSPVWAGATRSQTFCDQFTGDNTGDNISDRNWQYNELSVLYWGWKNTSADIKGLAHYRRLLGRKPRQDDFDNLLTGGEIDQLLEKHDVIVSPPRKFYFMTAYSHYVNSQANMKPVHANDLAVLREIIATHCPKYLPALEEVYRSRSAHMLNIFIMREPLFNDYCTWLFDILGHAAQQLKRDRVIGALGEFLLDVYIKTHRLNYAECPLIELERKSFLGKVKDRLKQMLFNKKNKIKES